jgi:hypothetical protein
VRVLRIDTVKAKSLTQKETGFDGKTDSFPKSKMASENAPHLGGDWPVRWLRREN